MVTKNNNSHAHKNGSSWCFCCPLSVIYSFCSDLKDMSDPPPHMPAISWLHIFYEMQTQEVYAYPLHRLRYKW